MTIGSSELFEIFSCVPAKAIYKFITINKSFSNLLGEPYFIKNHVHNMLKKDNTCFFLQQETSLWHDGNIMLYSLPGEQSSSGASRDVLRFLSKSAKILASTKGLIICRTTNNTHFELFICNPSTKSWLPIPFPTQVQENSIAPDPIIMLLECYDNSDDYMILHFEHPTNWSSYYACKVFNPKEGLWKSMERSFFVGGRNMKFNMPVHHNGAIHFISDCFSYFTRESPYFEPYIMSYNLENGNSTMLQLPNNARKCLASGDMGIFNWGKVSSTNSSICLVRLKMSVFKVWILTDYKESMWLRILKVRINEMGLREEDPKIKGFTVMNGGLLIFATEEMIYSYDLTNINYMEIEEICEHNSKFDVSFTPYLDTLRSCGSGATTLLC